MNSLNSEHTLGTQQTLPASTTEISVRDAQSLIAQARMEMATAPINDTEKTAHFIKRINQMHAMAEGLARGIEQFTYLKSVEHQVLRAVQKEVSHPRHIGRRVGMDTEATSIIVEKLESKGYVHVAERIGQRIGERVGGAGDLQAIGILLAVAEVQRIFRHPGGGQHGISCVEQLVEACLRADAAMELAARADRQIVLELPGEQHLAATGTLGPQVVGRVPLRQSPEGIAYLAKPTHDEPLRESRAAR